MIDFVNQNLIHLVIRNFQFIHKCYEIIVFVALGMLANLNVNILEYCNISDQIT
jgi:hypothetical protein